MTGRPNIGAKTYVSKTAAVLGNVSLGKNCFVAPMAVLRSDEPETSITIDDKCNIQDGVIIHAFAGSKVEVERSTSLSHGCIIHGPCRIGPKSFIGFRTIVFNSELGEGTMAMHGAVILNVKIPSGRLISAGSIIDSPDKVDSLPKVSEEDEKFRTQVVLTNLKLLKKYREIEKA